MAIQRSTSKLKGVFNRNLCDGYDKINPEAIIEFTNFDNITPYYNSG